jgi:succinate-acetate transporter protein
MAQYAEEPVAAAAPAVANPGPLGLSAFALTTFVLSSSNAGFIFNQGTGSEIVIGLALFYGGLVQLVAGIQAFRANNTFAATAFCSYGGFWLALGFVLLPGSGIAAALVKAGTLGTALGVFLLGWTIFTFLMFLATLRSTLVTMAVFGFLFLTFLFLTIGALGGGTGMTQVGGWLGIVTALLAWYDALAAVLLSAKSAFTLPTWPRP